MVLATLVLLVAGPSQRTWAGIIVENSSGNHQDDFALYVGQQATTPSGGPWHDLTFNFFSDIPATTPSATGTLFLLSQQYLGPPSGLSSATSGFIAESTGIAGNAYVFDPSVTIQPNTSYWFYSPTQFPPDDPSFGNLVSGEQFYSSESAGSNFGAVASTSSNFRLSGDVVPFVTTVPEPASLALFGLGGLGLAGWRRWRKGSITA